MTSQKPDISIIIPILNEAAELPALFESLAEQSGITFELLLCDGGSTDDSLRLIREQTERNARTIRIISTPPGRGIQMNAGADQAKSELLLFLHADSCFCINSALSTAVSTFRREYENTGESLAARFALAFRRKNNTPSLPYFFYEAKARLDRHDCIRGDQGLLISRATFNRLGRFDTSLPFLEDIRFAGIVARHGRWLLLPVIITTSARRFEQEGLYERQVVNAIIANAVSAGWNELFTSLPGIYRSAAESGRFDLHSFLTGISTLLEGMSDSWRRNFWRATGRYVSENAWQLFFWLDARRDFTTGMDPGSVQPRWLDFYRKLPARFFATGLAARLAQLAVKIWFRIMLIRGTNRTA
jgi:rSAM/selenodomain-associated transferase 2